MGKQLYMPMRRDVSVLKPAKFKKHLTIGELARLTSKDISWLRKMERSGRIPKAARVQIGQQSIRLWSPAQVKEIQEIFSTLKRGRPVNAESQG